MTPEITMCNLASIKIFLSDKVDKDLFELYDEAITQAWKALEKQIPKNPEMHDMGFYCPSCHRPIDNICGKYCDSCGQKIDRS